jgi:hypothetical protein
MERRVRNQARGLLLVSVALLLACTTMTALFGWSLGRNVIDKFIFAMGLAAADLGGAYLIATCGTFSASNEKRAASLAFFAAGVCCVLTLTGIIGFQSESREGLAQSRERAVRIVDSYVNWARDTTVEAVQKDKSKGAVALATGIETVGKAVRDQIGMLQTGDVVPLADGQATTISRIIGISEVRTRSWSIGITSAALLLIQYACLWCYGFMRHRIEPAVSALTNGPLATENNDSVRDSVRRVSRSEAKSDIAQLVAAGMELCNAQCAKRWGIPESQATKWLNDFARMGIVRRVQRGRRKVAVAPNLPNGNAERI